MMNKITRNLMDMVILKDENLIKIIIFRSHFPENTLHLYFILFIFYLFNVSNKNIQLKVYLRHSFFIKRKF